MSEWGTPDPHDAGAYPAPESTTVEQWAWQFLRRRTDYRTAWRKLVEPWLDGRGGFDAAALHHENMAASRRAQQEGRTLHWVPPWERLRDEFKVSSLPVHSADPDYPGYAINVTLDPRLDLPPHYEALGVVFVEVQQVPVVEPKMLIEFDVSLPLDPQMKGARRALQLAAKRDRAAAGREHAKDVRTRLNKFRDYLRLLDFKEADASNAEIGERLFPGESDVDVLRNQIKTNLDAAHRWQRDHWRIAVSHRGK